MNGTSSHKWELENSHGTEAPGRKLQLRLMQMKFPSLRGRCREVNGTGIGGNYVRNSRLYW